MRQNINAVIGSLLKKRKDKSKKDHDRELNSLPHHLCLKPMDQFPEYRLKRYHPYTGEKTRLVNEDLHQTLGHLVMAAAGVASLSKVNVNSLDESQEDSFDAQSTQTEGTLEHQRYPLDSRNQGIEMGSSFNGSLSLGQTDEKGGGKNKKDGETDNDNESNDKKTHKDEKPYAFMYLGLVILSLGCVMSFVGLGEKGFKTPQMQAIGPTCIIVGIFMVCFRVMQCYPAMWDFRAYYAKNKRIRPQVREPGIMNMAEQGVTGKMPNGGPPNSNIMLKQNSIPNQHPYQFQHQHQNPNPNPNLPNSSKSISTIEITSPPLQKVVLHSSPAVVHKTPRPMLHKSPQFQRGTYDIIDDEVLTRSYVSEIPFGSSSHYLTQQQKHQHQPQKHQSTGGLQAHTTRQYRIPQIID